MYFTHGPPVFSILGLQNRWGKLPYTMYDQNYTSQVSLFNYDMSLAPGRTYRWFTGKPLFQYGDGLSLTTFSHKCACARAEAPAAAAGAGPAAGVDCSCSLRNTGAMAGDEVVLVFDTLSPAIRAAVGSAHPVPLRRLVGFERASLPVGASPWDPRKRQHRGLHSVH